MEAVLPAVGLAMRPDTIGAGGDLLSGSGHLLAPLSVPTHKQKDGERSGKGRKGCPESESNTEHRRGSAGRGSVGGGGCIPLLRGTGGPDPCSVKDKQED